MFLFINTSNHQNINLALINKNGQILKWKKIKAKYQQSEKLLKSIDNLVPDIKKLKGIIVVIGPGGFTSLRIGVATANSLAWALNIPIIGLKDNKNLINQELVDIGFKKCKLKSKFSRSVLPFYGQLPNISQPKTLKKKNKE